MSTKRCLACHAVMNHDKCSACGSAEYVLTDENGSLKYVRSLCKLNANEMNNSVLMKPLNETTSWKDEYRKSKLNGIEIHMIGYSYEYKNGKIVEKSQSLNKICNADQLSFSNIIWMKDRFARIETNNPLKLLVSIRKDGKETHSETLLLSSPDLKDFWGLGAILTEGLGVRFVIGNDKVFTESDVMNLICE